MRIGHPLIGELRFGAQMVMVVCFGALGHLRSKEPRQDSFEPMSILHATEAPKPRYARWRQGLFILAMVSFSLFLLSAIVDDKL